MKKIIFILTLLVISFSYGQTKKASEKNTNTKNQEDLKDKALYPGYKSDDSDLTIDNPSMEEFDKVMNNPNEIYNSAGIEVLPEYEGGVKKFQEDFKKEFDPKVVEDFKKEFGLEVIEDLKDRIYISFIIEKDGSLSTIEIIRDLGFGTGREAIRVVKHLKKWTPGKQNGKIVRVRYVAPVSIGLQANASK